MRIAFIYPATDFDLEYHKEALPIGLLYLTSVAEQQYGAQVDIFDRRHGEALPSAERVNDYDLIGFTAMSMQAPTALRLARRLRQTGYKGPLAFGGPHASVAADHLKSQPFLDAIFVGEAEDTFLEYLRCLEGKPHSLGRVWTRDPDGAWRFHPSDRFIEDLDRIPFPARDKYGELARRIRGINLTSTRGCPFQCNYCQPTKEILFGKRVRRRSVGNIIGEIRDGMQRFGIDSFSIDDDTFTFHKKTVLEFCEQVRGLALRWSCQSRSDIERETLVAMRDSGLSMLYVGAESGSQRMLDLMNKRNSVEKNVEFMGVCSELGIQTWCNMMVGYPGETEEDLKKSLEFVRQTHPTRVCVSQVTPFPGTRLWESRRGDVIERNWDEVARHVHRAKFRSLARQQPLFLYYLWLMSKDWDQPLNADLLELSKASEWLCRRFPKLMRFYLKRSRIYADELEKALQTARSGQVEEGVRQLERVNRRYPKRPDPLGHLGWVCLALGRPAAAAEAYARLLRLKPGDLEARRLRAHALAQAGDPDGARAELQELLRRDPRHQQAAEALAALDKEARDGAAEDRKKNAAA